MIITKRSLPRRTLLRTMGATLALPLLDAMVPALSATAKTAANPARRLGVIYVPNGMAMEHWTPAAEGAGFELTPILRPLAPFRDRLLVLSNLNGAGGGAHAGASTGFLTGVGGTAEGSASVSMDQLAAKELGRHTQLASLEIGLDSRDNAGTCDGGGYPCTLTNTISWRSHMTPLPMENNPRAVFERMFGDSGSTDSSVRLARLHKRRSILDGVRQKAVLLERSVGPRDRAKISEYLETVRDVERRIQTAEEQSVLELPVVEQPAGIPATFEEHAKLMFDLQVLAYQCDLTRVITFMMGRELTGRTYPEIGVSEAHHPLSHHQYDPARVMTMAKINFYHVTLFAYYLEKLRSTPDGDGSLLDHVMLLYGAGISDSNAHDHSNLPILLVNNSLANGGRHLRYAGDSLANLLVTILDRLEVPVEHIASSTGRLKIETLSGI